MQAKHPFICAVYRSFVLFLLVFSLFSFSNSNLRAQEVYDLELKKDLPIFGAGALGFGISTWLYKKKPTLTEADISQLDRNKNPKFERFVSDIWSKKAQRASDVFLYAAPLYPLVLFADPAIRKDGLKVSAISAQAFLINIAATTLAKEIVQRKRPYVYNPDVNLERKMSRGATSSFYSGHTSLVSTSSFLTAKIYADYHPDSKWKPLVWTTASLIPAITGFLRVRGGKHFITDVVVGYLTGCAIGILIPQIHKTRH